MLAMVTISKYHVVHTVEAEEGENLATKKALCGYSSKKWQLCLHGIEQRECKRCRAKLDA